MAVTFEYDGSDASVTFDAVVGDDYWFETHGGATANGADTYDTATVPVETWVLDEAALGGAAGEKLAMWLRYHGTGGAGDGDYVACCSFVIGTPGVTVDNATWDWDGDRSFEVTFSAVSGRKYAVIARDITTGGSITSLWTATSTGTVTHDFGATDAPVPLTGMGLIALLFDTDPTETDFNYLDARLFDTGEAGAGYAGTTGGGGGAVEGRVLIAFDDGPLEPDPTWTAIDYVQEVNGETVGLVAGFDIDRGRPDQFSRTGPGTARVYLNDRTGLFDINNASSPYYGKLHGRQIQLRVWNPVREEWVPQFTGLIDDLPTALNPATEDGVSVLANVTIECVDVFDYLNGYELMPGLHGDTPPPGSEGTVWFDPDDAQARIETLLALAGIDPDRTVIFTLNVDVIGTNYDPGDSVLTAVRDACDADLPHIANCYVDKTARVHAHGRGSRFDVDAVFAGATPGVWDFHRHKAGDGAAILEDPERAQIREMSFRSPRGSVINSAICWPRQLPVEEKQDQVFTDNASIDEYGYHALSPMGDLIIAAGTTTGNTAKVECQLYAEVFVTNLADPKVRVTRLVFKSIEPTDARAEATWAVLTDSDISDVVELKAGYPGGVGIDEDYFVEGLEMSVTRANPGYDMVVLALDVSPMSDFADDVGLWPS